MSTIKVQQIQHTASSTNAITLASDGTCTANISTANITSINGGSIGTKNLIINGGLNVYQRGSTRASTTQGNGYATADRWKNQWNNFGVQATETLTDLTSSDSPYAEGHRKYLRFALASAGTAAAGSYIEFSQLIEAQNLATSGWDYTSSSSKITLQFWFRCSTNQTFYCSLQTADGTAQAYVFPFTASGNNAWTKITHTIPGNSNITFNNDNEVGLYLRIIPYFGTTYSGTNVTNNSWVAFNTDYVPDMATTWLTAGASTFDFTGVQLEVGSTASSFVFESYADTFRKCQRYFYVLADQAGGSTQRPVANLVGYTTSYLYGVCDLPVEMRTPPSIISSSGTNYFILYGGGGTTGIYAPQVYSARQSTSTVELQVITATTNVVAASPYFMRTANASTYVHFSAEL